MTQPLSRRSTLKVGAHAAWMVPTVSLAIAAPAYAGSTDPPVLELIGMTTGYGSDGPDAERPDLLDTLFTLTNTGFGPAANLMVAVIMESGFYDAQPSLVLPSDEFDVMSIEPVLPSGWVLRAMRTLPLGPGETTTLGTPGSPLRVQFADPVDESPYRRWAGKPFSVSLEASATDASSVALTQSAAASAPTYFESFSFGGSRVDDVLSLSGVISNVGRKTCNGTVSLDVQWEGGPDDGTRWTSLPGAATSPQLGAGAFNGGGGNFGNPYGYVFTYGPPRATGASFAESDPAPEPHCDIPFDITINLGTPPGYENGDTSSRLVYLRVTGPDLREDKFLLSMENISGSDS